jgi:hypothetical protein
MPVLRDGAIAERSLTARETKLAGCILDIRADV